MPVDHLRSWLTVRSTVPWHRTPDDPAPASPLPPVRDGAEHDVRTFDHTIDPDRAAGLLAALALARAPGPQLDFDRLAGWQQHVLGTPAPPRFRTTPAFAKSGRERYGLEPDTRARFDECLAQAGDPALPAAARAARAYLDVCFFHPFADGNARSAFLTLTHVLAADGITLDQIGPVRRLRRFPDDPGDALSLANLVASLIRHTRRRAATAAAH